MMWLEVLQSIWRIIQNPTVIVAIIGIILSGYLWIGKVNTQRTVTKLESKVVELNGQLTISKKNQEVLLETVNKLNDSQKNLKVSIKALQQQVRDEQATTAKWKSICQGKPVDVVQVGSKPLINKGVVVDEKSSQKYVDYINSMFKSLTK